jgi:pilus assembly protein CpaB
MVAIAPIAVKEQVLLNKLRSAEAPATENEGTTRAGTTLSTLTPKGNRAVTISVDAITGVGGFVRPGDKVDILWTLKLPGGGGDQVATLTLFQDVQVMAVGGELMGRPATPGAPASAGTQGYTVTLALDPQETSALLFAREQGRIQLSLRPKQEGGPVPVPPANISSVLQSQLGVAPAAGPPPATHQVEIFKGLKRDVMVLAEEE